MPELPEIETIVEGAKEKLKNLTIKNIEVRVPKMVGFLVPTFKKMTEKAKIKDARRMGKIIILDLSNGNSIYIHLKLTGQLVYQVQSSKFKVQSVGGHPARVYDQPLPHKFTHVILHLSKGDLFFNDIRKFGWLKVASTKDLPEMKEFKTLGPDPFDKKEFSLEKFKEKLKRRGRAKIKQVLLDQKFVSGIGNIYACEILYEAKVRPDRTVGSLNKDELEAIHDAIPKILKLAIKMGGSSENTYVNLEGEKGSFMNYAKVYQQTGKSCQRNDGGKIERITLGGRGTFFCPKCQK